MALHRLLLNCSISHMAPMALTMSQSTIHRPMTNGASRQSVAFQRLTVPAATWLWLTVRTKIILFIKPCSCLSLDWLPLVTIWLPLLAFGYHLFQLGLSVLMENGPVPFQFPSWSWRPTGPKWIQMVSSNMARNKIGKHCWCLWDLTKLTLIMKCIPMYS